MAETSQPAGLKKISIQELLENNGETGKPLWCMIHNKIYDLTNFKHPGGRDVLENDEEDNYVDKGREFDSVGHPASAIKDMEKYLIGELDKNSKLPQKENLAKGGSNSSQGQESSSNIGAIILVIALVVLILAFALGKI